MQAMCLIHTDDIKGVQLLEKCGDNVTVCVCVCVCVCVWCGVCVVCVCGVCVWCVCVVCVCVWCVCVWCVCVCVCVCVVCVCVCVCVCRSKSLHTHELNLLLIGRDTHETNFLSTCHAQRGMHYYKCTPMNYI